jgi:hypothetical protein
VRERGGASVGTHKAAMQDGVPEHAMRAKTQHHNHHCVHREQKQRDGRRRATEGGERGGRTGQSGRQAHSPTRGARQADRTGKRPAHRPTEQNTGQRGKQTRVRAQQHSTCPRTPHFVAPHFRRRRVPQAWGSALARIIGKICERGRSAAARRGEPLGARASHQAGSSMIGAAARSTLWARPKGQASPETG